MIRKLAKFAFVPALALTVAACGGNEPKGETASGSGGSSSKPGLRVLMQYGQFDPNQDYTAKVISEKTGYSVSYEMLPAENADEALNLLVINKEPYDVMKLNATQFFNLASSGALEPLDDLIDRLGPNIRQAIAPASWESATLDGKIYGIPETGAGIAISEELVVRQDWLDELGLKMPTNTDELYGVLKAFKEKKHVIPLTGSKDAVSSLLGDIAAAFGVTTDWVDVNGTLVHQVETEEMKAFLAYMNKLYSEGLLDIELPLNTNAKAIEKFSSGQAAMFKIAWYNSPATINALTANFPDARVSLVPFLKDKSGKASVYAVSGTSWYAVVPKFSKHKEDAVRFLDAKLQKDNFKEIAIGKEGVHHEVRDGNYYPILPAFNDDLNNASVFMTGVDEANYPAYWQARVRKDPILQSYFENIQANAEGLIVTDPLAPAPPIPEVARNKLNLMQLQLDYMINFIAGAEPLSNYGAFLEKWREQGGAEMTEGANNWYKTAKSK
ncbi:MAG: ABC transporter substrate-binding protein [Cohnella sp.]|uniref:extracellular solute-binding protein n=1 Tax=Cohnella sp. TaxID=1883426 RepID=UPI000E39D007|nr:extracellular solute-binding protein [Cohnella sp.]REK62506.1 MAG: ABC transporter substrate-binding protein [Cohnella sp.]